ncbi:MAG: hypothetical protein GY743_14690, partial [Planctomycetaceae bacterium]|nr:hypothetical protein [Planctomycetaceae bacterium]
ANYDWLPMVKKLRGKPAAILKTDNYPLLVTFTDINDPASVKRVDRYDLEKHFGAGVKLKAVTLEITGEPVTKGAVEKVLGWLLDVGKERGQLIPKPPGIKARAVSDMTIEEKVSASDFLSGEYWR